MAEFSPNKAGPQNTRELYYYVYQELQRLGTMLGDIGGGGGAETDPIFSASPAADITQDDIDDWNAGLSGGSGVKEEIESITLTTAGEFDFDNIPQGYKRLIIEGYLRSSASGDNDRARAYFNDDLTDGNYYYKSSYRHSASTLVETTGSVPDMLVLNAGGSPAAAYAPVRVVLEGYSSSAILKNATGTANQVRSATSVSVGAFFMAHKTMTDPITRIRIRTDNHPTDGLVGKLTLYGEY